jgi:hypothetical protein
MNRTHSRLLPTWQLQSLAPEHLLLLTIFGSRESRRRVSAELDRRAACPLNHFRAARRARLQPAA